MKAGGWMWVVVIALGVIIAYNLARSKGPDAIKNLLP